jgi:hypothetical protein
MTLHAGGACDPPITLLVQPSFHVLNDGRHRVTAAFATGKTTLQAHSGSIQATTTVLGSSKSHCFVANGRSLFASVVPRLRVVRRPCP